MLFGRNPPPFPALKRSIPPSDIGTKSHSPAHPNPKSIKKSAFSLQFYPEPASDILEVNRLGLPRIWAFPDVDAVFGTIGDVTLHYRDVRTLREGGWLNDEVMNAYINLIAGQTTEVLVMNTFFVEILRQKGPRGGFPLEKIHRILRRKGVNCIQVESIFERQKVIIPVNIDNRHWVCYCIDHSSETILYYDSLNWKETSAGPLLSRYVAAELESLGAVGKREYEWVRAASAVQEEAGDCGVFALMNVRNASLREQVDVDQELMLRLRRMITLELKQGKCL